MDGSLPSSHWACLHPPTHPYLCAPVVMVMLTGMEVAMSSMRSEKKAGVDVMPRSARGVAVKDDASNCRSSLTARKAAHTHTHQHRHPTTGAGRGLPWAMCGQVVKGWFGVVPVLRVLGVYGPSMSCTCNLLTRSRSVIHSGSKSLDVTARCAGGASGLRKGRTLFASGQANRRLRQVGTIRPLRDMGRGMAIHTSRKA